MQIPYQELSNDALSAVIEEFITREGTDYGDQVYTLEEKVEHVKEQLRRKEILINFDPDTQTCHISSANEA